MEQRLVSLLEKGSGKALVFSKGNLGVSGCMFELLFRLFVQLLLGRLPLSQGNSEKTKENRTSAWTTLLLVECTYHWTIWKLTDMIWTNENRITNSTSICKFNCSKSCCRHWYYYIFKVKLPRELQPVSKLSSFREYTYILYTSLKPLSVKKKHRMVIHFHEIWSNYRDIA